MAHKRHRKNRSNNKSENLSLENSDKKQKMNSNENETSDDNSAPHSPGIHDSTNKELLPEFDRLTAIENPTTADLFKGIILSLRQLINLETTVSKLRHEITTVKTELKEVKDENQENKAEILRMRGELNQLHQSKLDNDVIFTGFVGEPDLNKVADQMCQFYDFDAAKISNCYYFNTKGRNESNSPQDLSRSRSPPAIVVMSFQDKSAQIDFTTKRKRKGPMTTMDFYENVPEKENRRINCSNRLTKTNQQIITDLRSLHANKLIFKIRYRNCSFEVMEKENSAMTPIRTLEHLAVFHQTFY